MKKWMFGLLALAAPVVAENYFDPCGFNGCWEFGAEAIYWKACTPSVEMGLITKDTHNRRFELAKSDYEWGFRVMGGYHTESCCSFLTLGWTYIRSTDTKFLFFDDTAISGTFPFFPNLPTRPTVLAGKLRIKYNKVNLRGGRYLHRGCDASFYVYGGARYIDIEKKFFSGAVDIEDTWRRPEFFQKGVFSGGGLEAGIGVDYQLFQNLGLTGEIGLIAALGEQQLSIESFPNDKQENRVRIHIANKTACLPGVEFRAGLNLSGPILCFMVIGEIGWELDYYFDAVPFLTTPTTAPVAQSIGFSGPYASIRLRF